MAASRDTVDEGLAREVAPGEESPDEVEIDPDDDEDDEDEDEPEGKLRSSWMNDIQQALSLEADIQAQKATTTDAKKDTRKLRAQFITEQRRVSWKKKLPNNRTFLHFLASNEKVKVNKNLIQLVAQAVSTYPDQMGIVADQRQEQITPLTMAIQEENDKFLSAVCQLQKQKENIRNQLRREANHGVGFGGITTCVHAAIERRLKTVVRKKGLSAEKLKEVFQLAPENLYDVTNGRGYSPLHLAVTSGKAMAELVYPIAPKAAFLTVVPTTKWTPLHLAVTERQDEQVGLVKMLVDKCPAALSKQDSEGRTPLHLAVEYERSTEQQFEVVQILLEKEPLALKKKTLLAIGGLSPFQHHERTRQQYQEKAEKERGKISPEDKERRRHKVTANKDSVPEAKNKDDPGTKIEDDPGKQLRTNAKKTHKLTSKDPPNMDIATANSSARRGSSGSAGHVALDRRKNDNLHISTRVEPVTVVSPVAPVALGKGLSAVRKSTPAERWADQIRDRLKLEYLSTMKPQEAVGNLFVANSQRYREKQFWFDFGPRPFKMSEPLDEKYLDKQFCHVDFDSVLKYVAVPRLEFSQPSKTNPQLSEGREVMKVFFQWLKEKKGVRYIVRVEVDDMLHPHTDQAIEEALRGLNITVLDWKKPDLCSQMLLEADIKGLKELHLYWTGRNPVLRGWSEKGEGLAKMEALEKVFVHQVTRTESEQRTLKNIREFESRLSGKQVKYTDVSGSENLLQPSRRTTTNDVSSPIAGSTEDPTPHQWLECMRAFKEQFKNLVALKEPVNDSALNPVTVALIDDGCNSTDVGTGFSGISFNEYKTHDGQWRVSPFWQSASGHGTLMVNLIQSICPSAEIYVIRLKTFDSFSSKKIQIDPQSAIEAIKQATKKRVHIISMSWTIKPPEDPKIKDDFEEAVRTAVKQNIVLFCSASDQGNFPDYTYPYSAGMQNIFHIGAANARGHTSTFVDDEKLDFVLPGEDVTIEEMAKRSVQDKDSQSFGAMAYTGSSVATALAAGLAALVYECVRLGVIYSRENTTLGQFSLRIEDLVGIRTKEGMKSALTHIGTNTGRNDRYINVWNTFQKKTKELDEAGD